jgi:hypothetical protein
MFDEQKNISLMILFTVRHEREKQEWLGGQPAIENYVDSPHRQHLYEQASV